jgi:hypothetical protein
MATVVGEMPNHCCRLELVNKHWYATLYPKANGWYNGANIPGKRVEPMNFTGGIPLYCETLCKSLENGFQGLHVTRGPENAVAA